MTMIPGLYKFPPNLTDEIWLALSSLSDEEYKNGRTAAFFHVMSVIDSHLKATDATA